jgi:hypothetical protein
MPRQGTVYFHLGRDGHDVAFFTNTRQGLFELFMALFSSRFASRTNYLSGFNARFNGSHPAAATWRLLTNHAHGKHQKFASLFVFWERVSSPQLVLIEAFKIAGLILTNPLLNLASIGVTRWRMRKAMSDLPCNGPLRCTSTAKKIEDLLDGHSRK